MRIFRAFQETMFRFNLKGKDLAERSGLPPARISQLKSGVNVRIETLEKVLKAMPEAARLYMLVLIAVQSDEDEASENEAVDTEDDDE